MKCLCVEKKKQEIILQERLYNTTFNVLRKILLYPNNSMKDSFQLDALNFSNTKLIDVNVN